MSERATTNTTPFTGPHGSFWVVCEECEGQGFFAPSGCDDDEGCYADDCDLCHGNGGYWACIDDLCAALIDDWNR